MQYNTALSILKGQFEISLKEQKINKSRRIDKLNGELLKT